MKIKTIINLIIPIKNANLRVPQTQTPRHSDVESDA